MFLTDAAKRMGISYRTIKAIKNGERVGMITLARIKMLIITEAVCDQPENKIA